MTLKSSPDSVRAWQQRSRKPLKRGRIERSKGNSLRSKLDPRLVAWSRAIKKRDVFCQWPQCGRLGPSVTIDAHHKAPRSLRPDLKYELSNGVVLCRFHHELCTRRRESRSNRNWISN